MASELTGMASIRHSDYLINSFTHKVLIIQPKKLNMQYLLIFSFLKWAGPCEVVCFMGVI